MYLKHIEHLNAVVERFLYMIDPYEDELDHLSDNGNLSKVFSRILKNSIVTQKCDYISDFSVWALILAVYLKNI